MMKLSMMQAVVDTLDDSFASPIADAILAAWQHDTGSARYFRASANFIFVFTRDGQPCILRFSHESERTVAAIKAELAYLHHLTAQEVPVAQPISSLAGREMEQIATRLGVFHAVVFARLPGTHWDVSDLSLDQFAQWGHALGAIHQAAEGYPNTGRPTIHDHLQMTTQRLPPHEDAARRLLALLEREVAGIPTNEQSFGLIHYDFELDNLLWHNQGASTVDFDDCAGYWFAADIAFALRDLFADEAEQIDYTDGRLQAFVMGYRQVRAMTDDALAHLPLFLRIHNLVSFTKLLRAADLSEDSVAPAWALELQARLLRKAATYRQGFARATDAQHDQRAANKG